MKVPHNIMERNFVRSFMANPNPPAIAFISGQFRVQISLKSTKFQPRTNNILTLLKASFMIIQLSLYLQEVV